MRLLRQTSKGILTFNNKVTVDFEAFGPGIIAYIGENGGGKSAQLEIAAFIHGIAPSRGNLSKKLHELATGRDSFAETLWEDRGDRLQHRMKLDNEKRKAEPSLSQLMPSGEIKSLAAGQKAYNAYKEKRFGSEALFLAGPFMAQTKRGNFMEIPKAERRAVFAELLMLGHWAERYETAGLWFKDEDRKLSDLRRVLTEFHTEILGFSADETALVAAERKALRIIGSITEARLHEDEASEALSRARSMADQLAMLTTIRQACFSTWSASEQAVTQATRIMSDATARAQERLAAIDARRTEEMEPAARNRHSLAIAGLQGRRTRLEALATQQPAVTQAEAHLPGLNDERTKLDASVLEATLLSGRVQDKATEITTTIRRMEEIEAVRRRHEVATAALDARQTRLEELAAQMTGIVEAETALQVLAQERTDLESVVLAATNLTHRVQSKTVELTAAERRVEERRKTIETETLRLTRQTALLSEVPCTAAEEWVVVQGSEQRPQPLAGTCPLLKDARAASTELEALKNKGADPAGEVAALIAALDTLQAEATTATAKADAARERQRTIASEASEETNLKEIVGRKFAAKNASTDLKALTGERQHSEHQTLVDVTILTHSTVESNEALTDSIGGILALFEALQTENEFALTILQQEHDSLKAEQDRTGPQAAADVARLQIVRAEIARLEAVLIKKDLVANAVAELANIDLERTALDDRLTRDLADADEAIGKAEIDRQSVEQDRTAAVESAGDALATATKERDASKSAFDKADDELTQAQSIGGIQQAEQGLREAKAAREAVEVEWHENDLTLAMLRGRVQALNAIREKQTQIESECRDIEREISDWKLLRMATGPDGVPALEIDVAGGPVSEIANQILEVFDGGRYSIKFNTQAPMVKSDEMKEAFDVEVYDRGQVRSDQLISFGQRAVISEAIEGATAIFNSKKNDVKYDTLFRDETAGGLCQMPDSEGKTSAQEYMAMLRKIMEIGGFYQIHCVIQQPEVYALADVRLLVKDGKVTIDRGEQSLAA